MSPILADGQITGVRLKDGREFLTGAVVLTTGTFLRGLPEASPEA